MPQDGQILEHHSGKPEGEQEGLSNLLQLLAMGKPYVFMTFEGEEDPENEGYILLRVNQLSGNGIDDSTKLRQAMEDGLAAIPD